MPPRQSRKRGVYPIAAAVMEKDHFRNKSAIQEMTTVPLGRPGCAKENGCLPT